jgi:hypothetical protein
MKTPALVGTIERRLLINYRVDPDAVGHLLPQGFRPQLVRGWAVAGICLLRLGHLRPRGMPSWAGLRSENAAHRVAVEWDTAAGPSHGVYIPRRDSASLPNVIVGGRLFPGVHHRARFAVDERAGCFSVHCHSRDGTTSLSVEATLSNNFCGSALFADLAAASAFFEGGSVGYSDGARPGRLDGMRLNTTAWRMEPVELTRVRSSFFEGAGRLDPDAVELDCGFVMRNVPVTWTSADPMVPEEGELRAGRHTRPQSRRVRASVSLRVPGD